MSIYASYGEWKYSAAKVRTRCSEIIKALKELRKATKFDGIVLSGSSGVWLGGALLGHRSWPADLSITLCRKPEESSHGPMIEGAVTPARVVFVDDFVASGKTVARVRAALSAKCVDVVAVLEHCHLDGTKKLAELAYSRGTVVPVLRRL